MAGKTFCNVENRAFDDGEFVSGPGNVLIHATADPHTLDGWPAVVGRDGTGEIVDVRIQEPAAIAPVAIEMPEELR